MHNTIRICYQVNRNHQQWLPILFPEFSSRFDVTTAGQMKEKWRQAVPHSDISLAPSTPRRATFGMHLCGNALFVFHLFLFFLFYSFRMDEHLFTGHARVEHESSRGCFPPTIVIPFDTALNTNLTANWNTRNETCSKAWRRGSPLSKTFCFPTCVRNDRHTCIARPIRQSDVFAQGLC